MNGRHYYSIPAFAISSLFGGPLAALAFAAFEARGLRRLPRDLPWLLAGLAALLLASWVAAERGLLDAALRDLGTQRVPTWEHLAYRGLALLYFAGYWALHGSDRRELAATGVPPRPGYVAGLGALLLGLVGGTVLLLALRQL